MLSRGVVDITAQAEFLERLERSHRDQKPLVVKAGFDPTTPDLHLGHLVLTEKMRQFQQFGHDCVFLVGDYTARIGDPTGRNVLRPPMTDEQIADNAKTYTDQCFKVLDRERTRIEWNSSWLSQLAFRDVIDLASRYNLGRMLERRDFKQRVQEERQIAMHELLYPLVQGYDSVKLEPDIELGGADQIFNLNVGRHLMESFGQRPQMVLTVPLLVGLDGVDKMSKSKGNYIGVMEDADSMFGKVMSISDETMVAWHPLLTGELAPEGLPLEAKKGLAKRVVRRLHGEERAADTAAWWDAGRPPRNLEQKRVAAGPLFKVVLAAGGAKSGGDAQRKIRQGGVYLDGERWAEPTAPVGPGRYELKVGKKWAAQLLVVDG